jgi:hypothetical protein
VRPQDEADFRSYVRVRAPALRRTAHLLSGDWHTAEDLVQVALTKLYLNWRKVRDLDRLDGYARQVLVRVYLDDQRKRRRESPAERLPEAVVSGPEYTEDRELLLAALAQVPPRQRACWCCGSGRTRAYRPPPSCSAAQEATSRARPPGGWTPCAGYSRPTRDAARPERRGPRTWMRQRCAKRSLAAAKARSHVGSRPGRVPEPPPSLIDQS